MNTFIQELFLNALISLFISGLVNVNSQLPVNRHIHTHTYIHTLTQSPFVVLADFHGKNLPRGPFQVVEGTKWRVSKQYSTYRYVGINDLYNIHDMTM